MLSFAITNAGKSIQIYCDKKGLSLLKEKLSLLDGPSHVHLRTSENGGKKLNEQNPWGEPTVGEVIITSGG